MHPILAKVGPFTLHTYSTLINIGLLVSLARLAVKAPEGRAAEWLDAGLAAMLGGLAGARLGYVLANGAYFADHLGEAFAVWTGGLSWPGAAAGGVAALAWFARRKGLHFLHLLDVLALPIALLAALAWGGCLAAGCAYGMEVVPGEFPADLTAYAPDLYGLTLPRFPTQTAGVIYSLIVLGGLFAAQAKFRTPGVNGLTALAFTALGASLLGLTRADPVPPLWGLRVDTVASFAVLLICAVAMAVLQRRTARPSTAGA